MITTNIGKIDLTNNQILNWSASGIWELFSYVNGEVIAGSKTEPSQSDISDLIAELNALPDTLPQRIAEENFSTAIMLGAMGTTFKGVDAVQLAPYLSAIQNYADFKNFKGIKDFIAGLVALGKATPLQSQQLYTIFAEQDIDLGAYI